MFSSGLLVKSSVSFCFIKHFPHRKLLFYTWKLKLDLLVEFMFTTARLFSIWGFLRFFKGKFLQKCRLLATCNQDTEKRIPRWSVIRIWGRTLSKNLDNIESKICKVFRVNLYNVLQNLRIDAYIIRKSCESWWMWRSKRFKFSAGLCFLSILDSRYFSIAFTLFFFPLRLQLFEMFGFDLIDLFCEMWDMIYRRSWLARTVSEEF